MIFDKIKNADFYCGISKSIKIALEYLKNTDLTLAENGKYELDGDNIYIIIQDYQTKPEQEGKWEAHKNYMDIQFIIKGVEKLGFGNISNFTAITDYNEEKDIIFLEGKGSFTQANEGDFLIFTPEDAHMPSMAVENPEYVKKAVIKIKV